MKGNTNVPTNRGRGWFDMILIGVVTIIVVGVSATVGVIAYYEGINEGRRLGHDEAARVRRVSGWTSGEQVTLTITPAAAQEQATPVPAEQQMLTFDACETLPVIAQEVLMRAEPGLNAPVMAALPHGLSVRVECHSERLVSSVAWVRVLAEPPGSAAVFGWIPGQDIEYPPVCTKGIVKPDELLLRTSDTTSAEVVRGIPIGTEVGVICNSARGLWNRPYWVRVKVIINNEIVLGWAPAADVLD